MEINEDALQDSKEDDSTVVVRMHSQEDLSSTGLLHFSQENLSSTGLLHFSLSSLSGSCNKPKPYQAAAAAASGNFEPHKLGQRQQFNQNPQHFISETIAENLKETPSDSNNPASHANNFPNKCLKKECIHHLYVNRKRRTCRSTETLKPVLIKNNFKINPNPSDSAQHSHSQTCEFTELDNRQLTCKELLKVEEKNGDLTRTEINDHDKLQSTSWSKQRRSLQYVSENVTDLNLTQKLLDGNPSPAWKLRSNCSDSSVILRQRSASDPCFIWSQRSSSAIVPSFVFKQTTSDTSDPTFINSIEKFVSELNDTQFKVGFIDTHCHIDFLLKKRKYLNSFQSYIKVCETSDAFPKSFEGCVTVFCDPASFERISWWTSILSDDSVWGAFGCHPHFANRFGPEEEQFLRYALQHEKVKAAGEIGLDYSARNNICHELQKEIFIKQLSIALEFKKPVVIHCRDAFDDCFHILKETLPKNYIIHKHCFIGDANEAKVWMDHFPNLYLGFTCLVTQTNRRARNTQYVAQTMPLDRILLETDAPYFRPYYLGKSSSYSHPGMAIHVASAIAQLRNISIDVVLGETRRNTTRVYNI